MVYFVNWFIFERNYFIMETQENKLTEKESLDIITQMISTAKGNIQSEYIFFLIWGWVITIACLLHYSFMKFTTLEHPEIAWFSIVVGIILSTWEGFKINKKSKVTTYTDKIYGHIWIAFLVTYAIILFFMKNINYNVNPIILLLAGGSTYLSGTVIKFKPLVYGGIVLWVFGTICFLLPGEIQLLVTAVALIIGYLVPGYMLKNKAKNNV